SATHWLLRRPSVRVLRIRLSDGICRVRGYDKPEFLCSSEGEPMAMLTQLVLALFSSVIGLSPAAQAPPAVKLYVFDCGTLKSGNPDVLLARGVTTTDMSVTAYLIVHPKGTLLWDTGVIPDELVQPGGTTEARATVHNTLRGQLDEIGY